MRVNGADWERLGDDAARVAHFVGNRAFMRMVDGHCAALEVRVGDPRPAMRAKASGEELTMMNAGAREYFCTVYERRPQVCRDLARGSPECEGELLAKGGRVAGLYPGLPSPSVEGGAAPLHDEHSRFSAPSPGAGAAT